MLKEGLEIREYTLKTFLGKGGFGEVWLAEKKIEIADKKVPFALKFISDNTHGISDYSSVKREINTWIDASGNKNIISVQDGFVYENHFVIVSEYANNGSLRQWMREHGGKSPSLEKTVEMMNGILDGLTHLHAQNIIHRDLKPENILLKGEVPCIADFGVSRIVATASMEMSQSGTNTAGSPLYMSPESFERIKPSPQIDVWSAGVILFEMLSGKTPYAAETIPSLIFEIVTKEPRALPLDVPQSFHQVIKKALAKEISDRYSSAKEMREALFRALYSPQLTSSDSIKTALFQNERVDRNLDDGKSGIEKLRTLSQNKPIPVSEIEKNDKGTNKKLAWLGIGALIILAGVFGTFLMTKTTADDSNRGNTANINQEVTSEIKASGNSNINNETIANRQNLDQTVNKHTEKTEVEKEKTQNNQKPVTKAESAPKKDAPKTAKQPKKKVTLDDLIN